MRTKAEAQSRAEEIVSSWVTGAALTGWIPGSTIFLAGANMVMIRKVADTFGVGFFDEAAVKAHLGGVAGAAVGGSIAGEALTFIPLVGPILKAGALAGTAKLIGAAVIEYFYDESPLQD
jgi:uncharacterized protein (DUF697 family)